MLRCNDCRPLILDHLYGLLDAPEAAAVEAHLATCPECAATRAEAARVQGLIARAAKSEFPGVRFESPTGKTRAAAAAPARNPAAAPLPVPDARAAVPILPPAPRGGASARTIRAGRFLPWAVAAAVLLAVPGTVVPVLRILDQAETARRDYDLARAGAATAAEEFKVGSDEIAHARLRAEADLTAAVQAQEGLLARWVEDETKSVQAQAARKLTWEVRRPASVQPGAPNEFLLAVRDRNITPGGRVFAEVRDQNDAVIFSQPIDHEKNHEQALRLPASAWASLTPQSELFLVVTREDAKTKEKTVLQEKMRLFGPVFATVLTTDRPTYRPGDTVFFRSLTLDRATFTPPAREQHLRYELRGPGGAVVRAPSLPTVEGGTDLVRVVEGKVAPVLGPDGKPVRGVGSGSFALPPDAPDGDYTLILHETPHPAGNPPVVPFPVTRTVKVRSAAAEQYHKHAWFEAASYSAGETVEARAELKYKGKPVAGAAVKAIAVADDQVLEVAQVQPPVTGEDGKANVRFTLPAQLERGDVRLKVTFLARNGQELVEETVAERVPVVGRNVVVEFFPEGGDLVAGVPCRVYFRTTTPSGHPVEIAGTVTDGRREIAKVKTASDPNEPGANRGIGSFEFTPELGKPLWLKLESPAGAYSPILPPVNGRFPVAAAGAAGVPGVVGSRTGFLLPDVKPGGVVMTVLNPVTGPGDPFRVRLHSVARARNLVVGAYTRGRLSDTKKVTIGPDRPETVELMGGADPRGGVVRVTVFEEPADDPPAGDQPKPDLTPVAERLVFRRPGEALNLNFTATGLGAQTVKALSQGGRAAGFAPGSPVALNITATDEKGNPAAAILYAAAVNTAVAAGPKDRLLTTHFLLAGEVNTPDALEHADFLLTDHPGAAAALDRVLATQGWRRFAEQTPAGFAREPLAPNAECANLWCANGQYLTASEPAWVREQQRLREKYWPLYEAAVKAVDRAKANAEAAAADRTGAERARQLAAAADEAKRQADEAAGRAAAATEPVARFRGVGWYAVGGFGLLGLLLGTGSLALRPVRLPLGIGTIGAVGLAAFLVFALGVAEQSQAAGHAADAAQTAPADGKAVEVAQAPAPRPAGVERPADGAEPAPFGDDRLLGAKFGFPGLGGFGGKGGPGGFPARGGGDAGLPAGPTVPLVGKSKGGERPPVRPELKDPPRPDPAAGPLPAAVPIAPGGGPAGGPPFGGAFAGGTGAVRPGGGVRFPDGGWQPAKNPVPDDLLARDKELHLLEKPKHDRGPVPKLVSGGVTPPPTRGGIESALPAAPATDATGAKDTKADADLDAYRRAVDAAKAYADGRSRTIREQMHDSLGRRLRLAFEDHFAQLQQRAEARPGPPPADVIALHRVKGAVPTVTPLVVREYAAPRPGSGDKPADRAGDTILWQPLIVLPSDGKTTLHFHVGPAPGGYQVIVAGHTLDGRIGAVKGVIPVEVPAPAASNPPFAPGAPNAPAKP